MIGLKPPQGDFLLNMTSMGLKHVLNNPIWQGKAITPDILKKIAPLVQTNKQEQLVAWVAMLYGFHLLLRKYNLVPVSGAKFDSIKQLSRQDVCLAENALLVEFRWSKNLQYLRKPLPVPVIPLDDNSICLVYWTIFLISLIPAQPQDSLFTYYA